MAAALARRRKGVLALALSSPLAGTHAFNNPAVAGLIKRLRTTPTTSSAILRGKSTAISDDPSLKHENDFEWLKASRPMRIQARLLPDNGVERKINSLSTSSSSVTKIVHFQRHGQGTHNQLYKVWTEKTGKPLDLSEIDPTKNPLLLNDIIDAPLTPKGKDQCKNQRPVASQLHGIELIISSPLVRALQTAHLTFTDHTPDKKSNVKWLVHEGIREELGTLMCNKRRPIRETELEFPLVDYTHLPHNKDEDLMWDNHVTKTSQESKNGLPQRESLEDMSHRAYDFLVNFVHARPETEMAVVGHSAWLLAMTGAVLDIVGEGEDNEDVDESFVKTMFGQAELRSLELVFTEQ